MVDENRVSKLERTVIELGAETHRLRNEIDLCMESQMELQKKLGFLKKILDERGIILDEDFDIESQIQEKDPHMEEFKKRISVLKKVLQ